jgi:Raf kinase inhibitor-like YbhB/YbcL family protein
MRECNHRTLSSLMRRVKRANMTVAFCVLAAALNASIAAGPAPAKPGPKFKLETTSFKKGGDIPAKYTCSGEDISPALSWSDPPAGTQGFALIVDDPDAPGGTFTHWIVVNMKPEARELPEGINESGDLLESRSGGRQDPNDFGRAAYNGPCPPPGKPHRYFFRLYALDSPLSLRGRGGEETRRAVDQAMKGHILAEADVMGRFQRR